MFRAAFGACIVFALSAHSAALAQSRASFSAADTTIANDCFIKAERFAKETRLDSAVFYYKKAAELCEKLAARFQMPEGWKKLVKSYSLIGDIYRQQGDLENAISYLNKAAATEHRQFGENSLEVAQSIHNLGNAYMGQFECDKALQCFNRALAIRLHKLGGNHLEVAKSYNNIGVAHKQKYDFDKALDYLNKSLAIKYKLQGDNTLDIARTCNNLGELYRLQGDFERALEFATKSLSIRASLLPAHHPEVGGMFNNVGNIYLDQGDFERALDKYTRALEIAQTAGNENDPNVAGFYGNIGFVLQKLGRYERALEMYQKGLTLLKNAAGENRNDLARNYFNTGDLYLLQHDYDKALEYFTQALSLRLELFGAHDPQVTETYRAFAKVYLQQNRLEQAVAYAHRAVLSIAPAFKDTSIYANPILQNIIIETELLPSLSLKAQAFAKLFSEKTRAQKDLQMSLSTHQLAVELIDKMRSGYRAEGSKLILGQFAHDVYTEAIRTAAMAYETTKELKHKIRMFYLIEKSKATVLSHALQESHAKQFAGIPPTMLEKEHDLKIALTFYEMEFEKEKQKREKADQAKLRDYQNRYFTLKREYEKFSARLEKSYFKYYDIKYQTATVALSELQKSLDEHTAILEYFMSDREIFVFAITKSDFEISALPKDSTVNSALATFAGSVKTFSEKGGYLSSASQLYNFLIKPVEAHVANRLRWIIIPGGELYQVPFEALLTASVAPSGKVDDRALPYLIKQHEISYHYSATLFLKSRGEQAAANYANLFAGFAPVFNAGRQNGRLPEIKLPGFTSAKTDATSYLITRDGNNLDALPASEAELQNISAVFPKRSRVFLHEQATEENFKHNANGHKYVHVATHGFINNENPKLSNLAFSQPQQADSLHDGILFSGEIYTLTLNADLLVLSACQTGAGQILKGEGLMALTRGFFYSGARNIVASLWKVYDEHTSRLMVEFYHEIAAGKTYSAALREAKLKMIANPETAAPQSWAGFVLLGK